MVVKFHSKKKQQVRTSIHRLNNLYGKGEILSIVFPFQPWAGVYLSGGIVVRQMQYSMDAVTFKCMANGTIRFLGHTVSLDSIQPV